MDITTTIERHGGGALAVNVKDRTLYARAEPYASLIEQLDEQTTESLYSSTQEDFWTSAGALASEYGYGDVYSEGRMGGWLTVAKAPAWDEYISDDEPEPKAGRGSPTIREAHQARRQWLKFADEIRQEMDYHRAEFLRRLREAVDDLNTRREACLIRGEN